jgi:hypothetical protein
LLTLDSGSEQEKQAFFSSAIHQPSGPLPFSKSENCRNNY